MSQRFPTLAPQSDLNTPQNRPRARVRAVALPQTLGLPWVELALGLAFLILLRGV